MFCGATPAGLSRQSLNGALYHCSSGALHDALQLDLRLPHQQTSISADKQQHLLIDYQHRCISDQVAKNTAIYPMIKHCTNAKYKYPTTPMWLAEFLMMTSQCPGVELDTWLSNTATTTSCSTSMKELIVHFRKGKSGNHIQVFIDESVAQNVNILDCLSRAKHIDAITKKVYFLRI